MRSLAFVLFVLACHLAAFRPVAAQNVLDRSVDLGARGRLVLGEPLAVSGGDLIWPTRGPGSDVCFGPCFDADSVYSFGAPLPHGFDRVLALLDNAGKIHAIVAFHRAGVPFSEAYAPWRARFGAPTCGAQVSRRLVPTWLDPRTAIQFFGDTDWDPTSPMLLQILDRTNASFSKRSGTACSRSLTSD
jgi:hypothetical protein